MSVLPTMDTMAATTMSPSREIRRCIWRSCSQGTRGENCRQVVEGSGSPHTCSRTMPQPIRTAPSTKDGLAKSTLIIDFTCCRRLARCCGCRPCACTPRPRKLPALLQHACCRGGWVILHRQIVDRRCALPETGQGASTCAGEFRQAVAATLQAPAPARLGLLKQLLYIAHVVPSPYPSRTVPIQARLRFQHVPGCPRAGQAQAAAKRRAQ